MSQYWQYFFCANIVNNGTYNGQFKKEEAIKLLENPLYRGEV